VYIEYVAMEFKALGTKFTTWEGKFWENTSTILRKKTQGFVWVWIENMEVYS
jgi:hypothetical protein